MNNNTKQFYKVTGYNSLYFLYTDLPETDIRLYIKSTETATPCTPDDVVHIRYRGQPIYQIYKAIDRRSGLPYIAEMCVYRKQLAESGIVPAGIYYS